MPTKQLKRKRTGKGNVLRPTQIKILRTLVRCSADTPTSALSMAELVAKVKVSKVMTHFAVGAVVPADRDAHDARKGYKSLLSRGYVRVLKHADEWFVRYMVTALGRKAFEELSSE